MVREVEGVFKVSNIKRFNKEMVVATFLPGNLTILVQRKEELFKWSRFNKLSARHVMVNLVSCGYP